MNALRQFGLSGDPGPPVSYLILNASTLASRTCPLMRMDETGNAKRCSWIGRVRNARS